MQLKNNEARHYQFFYHNAEKKALDFVHIPAGATVELDDEIFEQICKPMTVVEKHDLVIQKVEAETPILMDKKDVVVKEYYPTGLTKKVNLVKEMIRTGVLTVVSRVEVSVEEKAKFLNSQGIGVKELEAEQIDALYNKLA